MSLKWFVIAVVATAGCPNVAFSGVRATISNVSPNSAMVQVCGAFPYDAMRLSVWNDNSLVADKIFCSSYGTGASASVVTDRGGSSYVMLRFGEGHGTNAVTDYLTVYTVAPDLIEYVRTPLSSASGPTTRWEYNYTIALLPSRGIRIVLRLTKPADGTVETHPSEAVRIIDIGAPK